MNLLLLQYNNYLNRIAKKYFTVSDYATNNISATVTDVVNWNPNDGIDTEQVINWDKNWIPDYLVAYTSDTIDSRWFVIECVRTRKNQYKLTLHRDVIIDKYDSIVSAPCYVEKAPIRSKTDVAIYNREDIEFNQIKQSETLLKDKTGVGWVVGYVATNTPDTPVNVIDTKLDYISVTTLSAWQYYDYITTPYKKIENYKINMKYTYAPTSPPSSPLKVCEFDTTGSYRVDIDQVPTAYYYGLYDPSRSSGYCSTYASRAVVNKDAIFNAFINNQSTYTTTEPGFLNQQDKYLFDTTAGKFYQISITTSAAAETIQVLNNSTTVQQTASIIGLNYISTSTGSNTFIVDGDVTSYQISLTEIANTSTYSFTFPATSRKLSDAPYRMFCIPYGQLTSLSPAMETLDEASVLNLASCIARDLGSNLFDIQLLPYCPATEMINSNGCIDITGLTSDVDYTALKDSNNNYFEIILYPGYSNFSFDISQTLSLPSTIENLKIENQCNKYRLCSPNYAAMFDFNLVKTGAISKFNVDCTYKPYSPYIHVNPNFSRLYGQDFNDVRGLICQGDFSLPVINDAWKQYQINNKNYLNSFNRQIETIELQNKYQKTQDVINAVTGTATGAIGGATTGALVGGGIGAAVGAVAGGITSAVGGIADVYINEQLRNDALDLTKDQFNYSLQNIQALPNTLAKISTFDYNNKIFPVLEFYTCTDQEKEIFKDKMKYNGMTIMRIDRLNHFIMEGTLDYYKGKIIRISGLEDDYHMATAIANELNKGVYI